MEAAAERVVNRAAAAIGASGRFSIALSGGSTPKGLYELLATPRYARRIDWSHVHVFWPMLHRVLEGPHKPDPLPAQAIEPRGGASWLVDVAAAAGLREATRR